MRYYLDKQLKLLNKNIVEMGTLIEQALSQAHQALKEKDLTLAQAIIDNDIVVDNKEKEIESLCLKLILSQQPVASDLRLVSTGLKMITDMERIADHAVNIAEICFYITKHDYIDEIKYIESMANEAIDMVKKSITGYTERDLNLVKSVIKQDDVVDQLFLEVKKALIARIQSDTHSGEQAFDIMQIARYYERTADHAVNIAEWVVFSITGKHKKTQVL